MAKTKEKFDLNAFHASVKKKFFSPIYFFYGEEDYLIEECVDAIIHHGVDPSMKEFNLDIIQGSEVDGNIITAFASAYPMMSERRVVVVKDFDKVSDKETVQGYLENPSLSTVLILIASNPDFRKNPYLILRKNAVCAELNSLYDNEVLAWIESRLNKLQLKMETDAVTLLQASVGNSLRTLANEIEKVIIAVGNKRTITVSDIEHVVGVSREFSVFELANKVGEKNLPKALEIAERMLQSGENAIGMIAALTNHFIRLWKLHDAVRQNKSEKEMLQFTYFREYVLKVNLAQAKKYKAEEIENAFILFAEADLALKSSEDPKVVLTKTITEIISGIVPVSIES